MKSKQSCALLHIPSMNPGECIQFSSVCANVQAAFVFAVHSVCFSHFYKDRHLHVNKKSDDDDDDDRQLL